MKYFDLIKIFHFGNFPIKIVNEIGTFLKNIHVLFNWHFLLATCCTGKILSSSCQQTLPNMTVFFCRPICLFVLLQALREADLPSLNWLKWLFLNRECEEVNCDLCCLWFPCSSQTESISDDQWRDIVMLGDFGSLVFIGKKLIGAVTHSQMLI